MFCRREISSGENEDEDWPLPLICRINFMMFRVLTSCANLNWASAGRLADKVLSRDKQDRSSASWVTSLWSSWRRKKTHKEIEHQMRVASNPTEKHNQSKNPWKEKHYAGLSTDILKLINNSSSLITMMVLECLIIISIDSYNCISLFSPLFQFQLRRYNIKHSIPCFTTFPTPQGWSKILCYTSYYHLSSWCLQMWSNMVSCIWYIT